jgi:cytoskeletal protein CcmA (bactofilin family)
MFSRTNGKAATRPPRGGGGGGLSFIGPEMTIGGDATTTGPLHVDGRIDGNVRCQTLIEGPSGTIAGDIVAEEARIAGLVEGKVDARTVIIEASGRVTGDVAYETISIAAGAQIDGRLARREALAKGIDGAMLIATPKDAEAKPTPDADPDDMFPTAARKRAPA